MGVFHKCCVEISFLCEDFEKFWKEDENEEDDEEDYFFKDIFDNLIFNLIS